MSLQLDPTKIYFYLVIGRHPDHTKNVVAPGELALCREIGARAPNMYQALDIDPPKYYLSSPSPRALQMGFAFCEGAGAMLNVTTLYGFGDASMSTTPLGAPDMEFFKIEAPNFNNSQERVFIHHPKYETTLANFGREGAAALLPELEAIAAKVKAGGRVTVLLTGHHGRIETTLGYLLHPDAQSATYRSVVAKTREVFPNGILKRNFVLVRCEYSLVTKDFTFVDVTHLGELEDFNQPAPRPTQPASPIEQIRLQLDGPTSKEVPDEHLKWVSPRPTPKAVEYDLGSKKDKPDPLADTPVEQGWWNDGNKPRSSVQVDPTYLAEAEGKKPGASTNER